MTNDIKNLLNIKDPNIKIMENSVEIIQNNVVIAATLTYSIRTCPICESNQSVVKNGLRNSKITLLSSGGQPTYLLLKKQRYRCKTCQQCLTAETQLVERHCNISKPTKQFIASQATQTISEKHIAQLAHVSTHSVRRVIDQMASLIRKEPTTLPEHLSFDEFKSTKSVKAAMSFIYSDAQTHQVIDIVEDRRLQSLKNYFYRFDRKIRHAVKTVTIDMYTPYMELIKQLFPKAKIIIDRFHLVQALNRELNRYRITFMHRIRYQNHRLYNKLKRYWKVILMNPMKLSYTSYTHFALFDSLTNTGSIVDYLIKQDDVLRDTYHVVQNLRKAIKESDYLSYQAILHQAQNQSISKGLKRVLRTFNKLKHAIKSTLMNPRLTNGP